uniref:Uncharacterized protein n=1 Tax=Romanomermis culicivorax TaxID=13658 RepID=A0A915I6L1_ROMCU
LSTSTTNQSQNSKISQTKISKTTNKQVYQSKGKLYYHKKLYLRGQCVILTTPDMGKMQAVIFSIGPKEIGFKINQEKVETKKISIPVQHLQQGKCTLKHKITAANSREIEEKMKILHLKKSDL